MGPRLGPLLVALTLLPAVAVVPSPAFPPTVAAAAAPPREAAATAPSCVSGRFCARIAALDARTQAAMAGVTWRPGCPVARRELRDVTLSYWGFDGAFHEGHLVVHRDAADAMVRVFAALFAARFPIDRMVPIEAYGGDDDASTKANNTSAFNCRPAFGAKTGFSQHAYGRAVDINPVQNPYVRADGSTLDPQAQRFAARSAVAAEPGVITAGGAVVRAFAAQGWGWGGHFRAVKDYQHFSSNGR
jgi:hypothetical protein